MLNVPAKGSHEGQEMWGSYCSVELALMFDGI